MSTTKESLLKQTKHLGDCEEDMDDKISQLPAELLLKVLLFLPTKIAVSTSILSKRWEFLWMWLPKLEYDDTNYSEDEHQSLHDFLNLNMPLHRAPVIESLRLTFRFKILKSMKLIGSIERVDIRLWIVIAVSRCLRELSVKLYPLTGHNIDLPSSLYISKSLVNLELIDQILVDVPRMACLPSLKSLLLRGVTYSDEDSLHQLLSKCPVLEDLVVERNDCFRTMRVYVPSLQRLTLKMSSYCYFEELMINIPSLKILKVTDRIDRDRYFRNRHRYAYNFNDMPKLEEADIDSTYHDIDKFVRSITSVKRLSLCIKTEDKLYCKGTTFNQLEHLKLRNRPCDSNFSKLLVRLLKDSPNLRELEVSVNDDHNKRFGDPPLWWKNQLNCIHDRLLSSLETFKLTMIDGSPREMDLAKYILRNACCLKTATILFQSSLVKEDVREMMIQELLHSSRGSTTCQLVFD